MFRFSPTIVSKKRVCFANSEGNLLNKMYNYVQIMVMSKFTYVDDSDDAV